MDTPLTQIKKASASVRNNMPNEDLVLTNWTPHHQSKVKMQDKDFKKLNSLAIKNKAVTSDK